MLRVVDGLNEHLGRRELVAHEQRVRDLHLLHVGLSGPPGDLFGF